MTAQYRRITVASTVVVKTGQGVLHFHMNNASTSGTCTIHDGIDATGPVIAAITNNTAERKLPYNVQVKNGITVVVTGAPVDITIGYS